MKLLTAHNAAGELWEGCVEGELVIPALFPCAACGGPEGDFGPDCVCGRIWLPLSVDVEKIDEQIGSIGAMCAAAMVRDVDLDTAAYVASLTPAVQRLSTITDEGVVMLANTLIFRHRTDPPGTIIRRRGVEFDHSPPPTGGGGLHRVA